MGLLPAHTTGRKKTHSILAVSAGLLLLFLYHRCSPYICPPRSGVHFSTEHASLHDNANTDRPTSNDSPSPHPDADSKAVIVSSMSNDNTSWLAENFSDWELNIYTMDDPAASLTVPENKGRESMAYLTYIINNYDNLPTTMVFLHAKRYQWHNEDPMYDGIPPLNNLQFPYVQRVGYANLRCTWRLGCPTGIKPGRALTKLEAFLEPHNDRANVEAAFPRAFAELFPDEPVPSAIGAHCGAQFAVARWRVRRRTKEEYMRYREWLRRTTLRDAVSGRVMEYAWHIIMGMPAVNCPPAEDCFCQKFGLCNLTCLDEGSCEKRYMLPKNADIPPEWPEVGPGQRGYPNWGWWE